MPNPRLSIVTPHRPDRELLTDTRGQTFKDFEHIVVTDEHLRGQCWARNQGVERTTADYILFLDDDLILEDDCLEKFYNGVQGHSFAYCNFWLRGAINGQHIAHDFDPESLRKNNFISSCSIVKRSDFCGWDESLTRLVDWDVWLTMSERGYTGKWIDEFLFTATYRPGDISVGGGYEQALSRIKEKHRL
jgi:glycosyltransferase involved in cell wall biosynthesis